MGQNCEANDDISDEMSAADRHNKPKKAKPQKPMQGETF